METRQMLSDQELIQGCAKSDRTSQRLLYDRFSRKMMLICMRYSKSREAAEDILQDAFVKIFANLKKFRGEAKLETWITRIVINTAITHQQNKFYLIPLISDEEVTIGENEEVSFSSFNLAELVAIIQSL